MTRPRLVAFHWTRACYVYRVTAVLLLLLAPWALLLKRAQVDANAAIGSE